MNCFLFVEIRMLQTGTVPDDETYNLVISLLIRQNLFDSALKYLDLMLKSGHTLSLTIFNDYVRACVRSGRLDTLASIIEKCKVFILGIVNVVCLSYLGLSSQCFFFCFLGLDESLAFLFLVYTFCMDMSTLKIFGCLICDTVICFVSDNR